MSEISITELGIIANDPKAAKNNRSRLIDAFKKLGKDTTTVIIPEGTFYFEIPRGQTPFGMGFAIPNYVSLKGSSREKSIIQFVAPNSRYWSAIVIGSGARLENLTIKDDMTNNQMPSTTDTSHKDNPQALIEISGLHAGIYNCDLHNSSTWCVYADDSAKNPSSRRDYVTIKNCRNYWHKRSIFNKPFDISQCYIKVDNMELDGNEFYTDDPNYTRTVYDISGNCITVTRNKVYNYVQPLLMMNDFWGTDKAHIEPKYIVRENSFIGCKLGVYMYPVSGKTFKNIYIEDNEIVLNINHSHSEWDSQSTLISGISVYPMYWGDMKNVNIRGNHIEWVDKRTPILTHPSLVTGIGLFNGIAGRNNIDGCIIEQNTIRNFPFVGISVGGYQPSYKTKNVLIRNNLLIDNGIHHNLQDGKNIIDLIDLDFYFSHILLVLINIENVEIKDNTFIDTGENEAKGVYWLAKMEVTRQFKNITISRNNVKTTCPSGLGTNIRRDSSIYVNKDGEPLYNNLFNTPIDLHDSSVIKYCRDIEKDIIDYDTNDIIFTAQGHIYRATGPGTTGPLEGVTVKSRKNSMMLEVNDGSKLRAGNTIRFGRSGAWVTSRVTYVKGNLVRLAEGGTHNVKNGDKVMFYRENLQLLRN